MSYSSSSRAAWWLIAVSLLINAALLVYILEYSDPKRPIPHPPLRGPALFLQAELDLDEAQRVQYDDFLCQFHQDVRPRRRMMNENFKRLFALVGEGKLEEAKRIAERIGELEAEIGVRTFTHLETVQEILNPEQQQELNRIMQEAFRGPGPGPGPGRPKGRPPFECNQ